MAGPQARHGEGLHGAESAREQVSTWRTLGVESLKVVRNFCTSIVANSESQSWKTQVIKSNGVGQRSDTHICLKPVHASCMPSNQGSHAWRSAVEHCFVASPSLVNGLFFLT